MLVCKSWKNFIYEDRLPWIQRLHSFLTRKIYFSKLKLVHDLFHVGKINLFDEDTDEKEIYAKYQFSVFDRFPDWMKAFHEDMKVNLSASELRKLVVRLEWHQSDERSKGLHGYNFTMKTAYDGKGCIGFDVVGECITGDGLWLDQHYQAVWSPLHVGILRNDLELVKILMRTSLDFSQSNAAYSDDYKEHPYDDDEDIYNSENEEFGDNSDDEDPRDLEMFYNYPKVKDNVLHLASRAGHVEMLRLLIQHLESKGIDLVSQRNGMDRTPLDVARSNPVLINLLLHALQATDLDYFSHISRQEILSSHLSKRKLAKLTEMLLQERQKNLVKPGRESGEESNKSGETEP